jgi:ubiquinone/menaquinone biosynthesis C-methylase UbiE
MGAQDTPDLFTPGAQAFEQLAPALWNPMGNAVAAAADIKLGETVLDACCGSGASTLPAAQYAGPDGRVDGIDLSPGLLDIAAGKVAALNLDNVELAEADLMQWQPETPYDAVLCCYGLFLVPDMAAGTRKLADLLRPEGRLALSTWDEKALQPFADALWECCTAERASLADARPWPDVNRERINSEDKLTAWLLSNGFRSADVERVPCDVPLDAELAWCLVQGTGYRSLLPRDTAGVERVRESLLEKLGGDASLNADTLIAVARK